ncbi:MAG: hypothetical protein OXI63_15695 [Candidatus Poribacteria bacterium]|nr:hypothetical protein [Candidatus Poribacteria bacterium]
MKILTIFGICVLMLAGCTSVEYQKMQAERDQLLKNYEDLREENSELKVKDRITGTLLGKWKFLNLEMAESGVTQEVAEAKAALYALELRNLTLEFFEEKGIYHYRGKKGGTEVFGQWTVVTIRYGDEPFPFIRFVRRAGPELEKLLFAATEDGRALGLSSAPGLDAARDMSISVTSDRLYLTMHGKMQSGPAGWVQSGGVRCYFERIEQ